jgi:GNAT superfamily N-acetyltransferase
MNLTYPPAAPEDLAELLGMMKELQSDDPWSCPFDEATTAKVLGQLLDSPGLGRVWFIAAEGKNIGYIVMSFDYSLEYRGRNAWIDEFFVRRSHRGVGVGTHALEFFAEQARQLGVAAIHLEVNHGNPAIDLYRRTGFEDHHRYLMTRWIFDNPKIR